MSRSTDQSNLVQIFFFLIFYKSYSDLKGLFNPMSDALQMSTDHCDDDFQLMEPSQSSTDKDVNT